ncbi:hypothetical protein ACJ73_03816 [Blastomyces percursus]|uniref:Uncharacterized protein n=1 Tax=Blastomyces percursus TaxID=1658174 RepID=A0A1J9Q8M8_9EURO|nr:hypothetical protein ACJ73_03816 [Blastomyces percursus]
MHFAKQNCKEVEIADHIAIISSSKRGTPPKINIEQGLDWQEIIGLLKKLNKKDKGDLTVEITTYFNLIDISMLSSNESGIRGPAAFVGVPDSQLETQALISKRALDTDVKEENSPTCKPSYRPAKLPRIHEMSDDEKPARSTATSQQLKEVQKRRSSERESILRDRLLTRPSNATRGSSA